MTLALVAILVGFAGLIWSADRFVAGAAGIARNMGMAPMMIGLTIVAIGTSAPELIVSINAALDHAGGLAIGNAIGSNLANVGLVLGVTALISPIPITASIIKRELPLLLIATFGALFFLLDNKLELIDGIAFLAMLAGIFYILVTSKSHQPDAELATDTEHVPDIPQSKAWLLFFVGLILLIASSRALVWGSVEIAAALGVSDLIIGLTVVAVGTSLPELAATVASALKGHHDIALGNIIGSNLFNLLGVMAMPAMITPSALDPEVFSRDYLSMTAITLLLAAMLIAPLLLRKFKRQEPAGNKVGRIGRGEGALLLLAYGAYYYLLLSVSL
ncbi:MAG: calcium/sodium antiporter [Spongiibacteraceae bacterium]